MIFPVISQVTYPGVGDVDDCAVIATFWAARAAGYRGTLPTVTDFRAAAGNPDDPGSDGLTNLQVWRGVTGTILDQLGGTLWQGATWASFRTAVLAGAMASVAMLNNVLPAAYRYGFDGPHRNGLAFDGSRWRLANPLAPNGSTPMPITEAYVREATLALGAGKVQAVTFPIQEATMVVVSESIPAYCGLGAGVQLYDLAKKPLVKVSSATQNTYSPFVSGTYRAVVVVTGGVRQLALAKTTDCANVRVIQDVRHTVELLIDGAGKYKGTI